MMMWIIVFCLLTSAVLTEQGEVARGYVGENVTMEFSKPSKVSFLYHYDKKVSIIQECECLLFPGTQFAGRLRCSRDEFETTCTIIIQNVTQRDAGLYKLVREDTVIEERFLNITGTASTSTLNPVTLQGNMTRTQLHQVLTEAHYSQWTPVKPNSSNTSTMNTGTLDPSTAGSQLLSVSSRSQASSPSTQGTTTTSTLNPVTLQGNMTRTQLHQVSTVAQNNQRSPLKSGTTTMNPVTLQGSMLKIQVHQVTTKVPVKPNEIVTDLKRNLASEFETVKVPIYFVPVTIAAFGVMNLIICLLIWMRRKNSGVMEPERNHALKECETNVYLTPIAGERQLPKSMRNNGSTGQSRIAQNILFDSNMRLLHWTQSLCMDGYEVVDISGMDGLQNTSYNEQSIYESSQTINTHIQDASGYLTVLGVLETPV